MNTQTRRVRRIAAAVLSGIAAAALLVGCGMNGGGAGGEARTELKVGIGQLAPSVDIHVDTASTSRAALTHVYDRLVEPDYKGGWLPSVATEWEFNEDITELTFTLRDDVTFTNGEKLDAAAVKYSVDRILDPDNKAYSLGVMSAVFSGAEVIDDTHVKLLVKNHDALAMASLAQLYLVPPEHSEKTGMGMGGEGVGSGPMMIESFSPNDHMTLVPNPDYWGDKPVENLEKVTFLSIEDEAARSSALDTGRADVVFPMSPDIWKGLEDSQTAKPVSALMGQYQNLFLGKHDQDTPLKDQRVRQAVNYAIDKQSIVDSILLGTTEVPSQMVPEDSPLYNPELEPWPYDPDKARELLAEAGYPDGFSIDMESTTGRTPGDREVASAIVDMLGEVGIEVNWTPLPATEWLQKFVTGTGAPLYLLNTSVEPSMMSEAHFSQWTSDHFSHVMADPEFDKMVADMRSTVDDEERAEKVQELSAVMLEKQPLAMLYQVPMLYGVKKDVQGFEGRPDMSFDLTAITIGG